MLERKARQRKKLALVISLMVMAPLMLILAVLTVQAENWPAKQQSPIAIADQQLSSSAVMDSPADMEQISNPEANNLSRRYLSGMRGPDSLYLERAETEQQEAKEK